MAATLCTALFYQLLTHTVPVIYTDAGFKVPFFHNRINIPAGQCLFKGKKMQQRKNLNIGAVISKDSNNIIYSKSAC